MTWYSINQSSIDHRHVRETESQFFIIFSQGHKVELPTDPSSQNRRPAQIIQPYTIDKDPGAATSDGGATSDVDGAQASGEYPSFVKESAEPSTVLISTSSHSTTPQEIAYTATSPSPISYAPLQEVRNIYANNDYQNAALIDEQLFLQSAAGNFGQRVHSASIGESGLEHQQTAYSLTKQNGDVTYNVHSGSNSNTAYLSAAGKIKKAQRLHNRYQNREKFVSSTTENPNYSFTPTSPASVATASGEFTSNDLVSDKQEKYESVSPSREFSKFGPADPSLLNYGLAPENEGQNGQGTSLFGTSNGYLPANIESDAQNSGLQVFSSESSTVSSDSFRPIVVAEVTPGYEPEHSTACKCNDDLVVPTTPTPISSTTPQALISTVAVTPKYQNQDHITTSAVILNPIQAGVALVNAGEAHLITDGESKVGLSQDSESKNVVNLEERIQQLHQEQQDNELRIENEAHQEQLKKVQQLQEEIQLQQVQQYQQELQLQQNQYEIQSIQLEQELQAQIQLEELQQRQKLEEEQQRQVEKQIEEFEQRQKLEQEAQYQFEQQQKYQLEQLTKDTQLQQDVELQQVEESQQRAQLREQELQKDIKPVHESKQDVILEQQIQDQIQIQQQEEQQQAQFKIQGEIEQQQAQQLLFQQLQLQLQQQQQQQLELQSQVQNSIVQSSSESNQGKDIEIQKSIEIYHNEPVREIHYPAVQPIDQSQGRQQYVEVENVENTEQAYGAKVSFDINHGSVDQGYQIGQQEVQFSLGTDTPQGQQVQQVFVGDNQAKLNEAYDSNRVNALSQQTSNNNGFRVNHESGGGHNYQIDQHRDNGILGHEIDQPTPQRTISTSLTSAGYLNQRDQSHSHFHSHYHSHEGNRAQQQVAGGLQYTLQPSKELVLPGLSASSGNHVTVLQPYRAAEKVIEKTVHIPYPVEKKVPFPVEVEKIIEKQVPVHVLRPYPVEVEKIIEKKVPYPVDRIVEKHVPILQPYPIHIKVPHPYPVEKIIEKPYPVETIVEKPVHIHVPVEKIVEKKVPVPQPYPVEVEKIIEKKVPYPIEVTKYVDKPYPVEKIIRIPYAVDLGRNFQVPYGVHYGVSYQQIMRPHGHNLYVNHGKTRTPFYGLPVVRHQEISNQFQGYSYDKPAVSFVEGAAEGQHSLHQNLAKHVAFQHYPLRRQYSARVSGKEKTRSEEYIGPVPPRSSQLRHIQHSMQNKHVVQSRSPQSLTPATRSPTSTTTSRRVREPETKPQSSAGNFRQSRVEYGFKPPMIPSVQYDEKTATKVES